MFGRIRGRIFLGEQLFKYDEELYELPLKWSLYSDIIRREVIKKQI